MAQATHILFTPSTTFIGGVLGFQNSPIPPGGWPNHALNAGSGVAKLGQSTTIFTLSILQCGGLADHRNSDSIEPPTCCMPTWSHHLIPMMSKKFSNSRPGYARHCRSFPCQAQIRSSNDATPHRTRWYHTRVTHGSPPATCFTTTRRKYPD